MILPSAETVVLLLQGLVVPLLLIMFILDGMIVGKVTPPAAVYIAFVVLIDPVLWILLVIVALCVCCSTLGQFTVFRGFNEDSREYIGIRRRLPYIDRLPGIVRARIGPRRMRLVERLFAEFGGPALLITNAIPGIRSLMSIPAGLSHYSTRKFLLFSTLGNLGYLIVLTGVAWGLDDLLDALMPSVAL